MTTYIPALRFHWLTRFYHPLMQWALREREFKAALIAQANLKPSLRVLDVGCGAAALVIQIKQMHPDAVVTGLDGDERILALARKKTAQENLDIAFDHGFAYALPYANGSFDRIFSSLMLHPLTREDKQHMLREMRRVLRPGGELHIADWSKPAPVAMEMCFSSVQILDGREATEDNTKGLLLASIERAGFLGVHETQTFGTLFGKLALFKARKAI